MNSLNLDEYEKQLFTTNENMEQRKCFAGIKRPTSEMLVPLNKVSNQSIGNGYPTLKVLIVDDNPFNLLVLEKYLKRIKTIEISIEKCLNGDTAVESFKNNNFPCSSSPINLIFLDLQLPIKDGFEVCQEINNLVENEEFRRCSVIGISGLVEESHRALGLKLGMRKILSKPASLSVINEICEDIYNNFEK